MLRGRSIGSIDLLRIMAATGQCPDLVVGHAGDHRLQFRILAKEMLPHVGAVFGLEVLVLAVDCLLHALQQDAGGVASNQRIPARAPDVLDDVPAGAAEDAFQLLDDLAIAAHWPIEALQVAVDDEYEVVESLTPAERDGAEAFRLIGLAIAEKAPDLPSLGLRQAAALQVFQEACLVDGHQRAEAHGDGRELPEIRHQPGMWIGAEAATIDLLTEAKKLLLGEPALDEGARVDTGRAVALDEDQVTAMPFGRRAPEMHKAGVIECRRRLKAGDVPTELRAFLIRAQHDGQRVPADIGADAMLNRSITGMLRFPVRWDGVEVGRCRRVRDWRAATARSVKQFVEQEGSAILALDFDDSIE